MEGWIHGSTKPLFTYLSSMIELSHGQESEDGMEAIMVKSLRGGE